MKQQNIEFKKAGYKPTREEEYGWLSETERAEREEPKMKYARVYVDDARMLPIDLSGVNAGDDITLCIKANVSSKTSTENEGKPKREEFTLEIIGYADMQKATAEKKEPGYMAASEDKDMNGLVSDPLSRIV